jgi:hypothetical protein
MQRCPRRFLLFASLAVLALSLGSGAGLAPPAQAQEPEVICDDNASRERRRSVRRRAGGANRDCTYAPETVDEESGAIVERAVPRQRTVLPRRISAVPRPSAEQFTEAIPIPDRWRIVNTLGYPDTWWDPYNQNTIKGDRPIHDDWFFNVSAISDTVLEARSVPTPVGVQTTRTADSLDVLGGTDQSLLNQNLALEFVYYKGDTVFRPPDWEFRFTPVLNYNVTRLEETLGTNADPAVGRQREDSHVGIQGLRRQAPAQRVRALRLRQPAHRHPAFLKRLPRLPVPGQSPRHPALRHPRQQSLPVQPGVVPAPGEGHQQRSERCRQSLRDDDVFIANLYLQDQPTPGVLLASSPWPGTAIARRTSSSTTTTSSPAPRPSARSASARVRRLPTSGSTATGISAG